LSNALIKLMIQKIMFQWKSSKRTQVYEKIKEFDLPTIVTDGENVQTSNIFVQIVRNIFSNLVSIVSLKML